MAIAYLELKVKVTGQGQMYLSIAAGLTSIFDPVQFFDYISYSAKKETNGRDSDEANKQSCASAKLLTPSGKIHWEFGGHTGARILVGAAHCISPLEPPLLQSDLLHLSVSRRW